MTALGLVALALALVGFAASGVLSIRWHGWRRGLLLIGEGVLCSEGFRVWNTSQQA
jgi:hypothetical protein